MKTPRIQLIQAEMKQKDFVIRLSDQISLLKTQLREANRRLVLAEAVCESIVEEGCCANDFFSLDVQALEDWRASW